jgi:hypothetical protein
VIEVAITNAICGTMQTSPECRIPEDDCVEKPSDVIVRWKGPGAMLAKENCPSSPVVISWFGD